MNPLISAAIAMLVWHNGSIMNVRANPDTGAVIIEYAQPKPELLAIGVRPGTLLFDGQWASKDVLVGNARVYNLVCGSIPYRVEGGIVDPAGTLVLRGPQLRVNQWCQPYYYEWTVNSELIFYPQVKQ
jgi:hypothetical protein